MPKSTTTATSGAPATAEPVPSPASSAQAAAGVPRFRVTLQCPTPVASPELDVDALDEADAWNKFCAANGISGSDHPRTIVPL